MDRKQSEQWESRVARTINSATCFSLAYVILTYLLWLVTGLTGRLFKFDSFVYYYGVKFILNGDAWNKLRVALVYSSGPFSMLVLAVLAIFLFSRMKRVRTILNLFFLWVFIIGIGLFMSQIIMAALGVYHYNSIYYQSLAVCFAWLRTPPWVVYVLNVVAFLFIVYIGVNCARPFLLFSFSFSKVNNLARRRKYFFETAIVPYIVGSLLTIVVVFPKELSAKSVLILLASTHIIYIAVIGMILGIGWLSLAYIEMSKQELARYKSLQMPNIVIIILTAVAWAFVYVTFSGVYMAN